MYTRAVKTFLKTSLMLVGITVLSPLAAAEDAPENYQVVKDVEIFLGVIPAQIVRGHPREHPEASMHKGVPAKAHSDHVVVALFDKTTGQRIEDAKVTGSVMESGMSSKQKDLEVMRIAGSVTYGNYFTMQNSRIYHIKVRIHRPGIEDVVEAQFTHRHFEPE